MQEGFSNDDLAAPVTQAEYQQLLGIVQALVENVKNLSVAHSKVEQRVRLVEGEVSQWISAPEM